MLFRFGLDSGSIGLYDEGPINLVFYFICLNIFSDCRLANNFFMKIPKHLAIIMDGNRRWAKHRNKINVTEGHRSGADTLEDITRAAAELGVEYLTMYTFSTENFSRSKEELKGLFDLCVEFANKKWQELQKEKIKVKVYGSLGMFPAFVEKAMKMLLEKTNVQDSRMTLGLCFGYGGRQEIVEACKSILEKGHKTDEIDEELFEKYLYTAGTPDVDLMIRTGGAERISNFLLWKLAYAEFYFTDKFWPEFTREDLKVALEEYADRERRFGK